MVVASTSVKQLCRDLDNQPRIPTARSNHLLKKIIEDNSHAPSDRIHRLFLTKILHSYVKQNNTGTYILQMKATANIASPINRGIMVQHQLPKLSAYHFDFLQKK